MFTRFKRSKSKNNLIKKNKYQKNQNNIKEIS